MALALGFCHLCSRLLLIFLAASVITAVEEDELESMLTALRVRGYELFSNAIATSDVIYEIFNGNSSFTLFAPTDSSLFTVDMINSASHYTSVLRCHVVPSRLTLSELRRLPSGYSLETFVKNHAIRVEIRRNSSLILDDGEISLDGVEMVLPGMFYSRDIAVHGLGGILMSCLTSGSRSAQVSSSPTASKSPVRGSNSSSFGGLNRNRSQPMGNFTIHSPGIALPPIVDESAAAPPPMNFTDFLEPPTSRLPYTNIFPSPVPEPSIFQEYSPPYSPDTLHFPPEFSLPPLNLSSNHGSLPPAIGAYSPAPSREAAHFPPANFCAIHESAAPRRPIDKCLESLDNNTKKTPTPEPAEFEGYLSADSPANFSGDHRVLHPVVNETKAPPLANGTNTIKSLVPELANHRRGIPTTSSPEPEDYEYSNDPTTSVSALDLPSLDEEINELPVIGFGEEKRRRDSISPADLNEIMGGYY